MAEKWSISGEYAGACICDVTCPCNLGQNPSKGHCFGIMAFNITSGKYGKVDVSGRKIALAAEIPGNPMDGNWKGAVYVDEGTTQQQQDALIAIFSGQAGGVFAELAGLIAEIRGVKKVPIEFKDGGAPSFQVGTVASVQVEPLIGADQKSPMTLNNGLFAFRDHVKLGKTSSRLEDKDYGWKMDFTHAEFSPIDLTS